MHLHDVHHISTSDNLISTHCLERTNFKINWYAPPSSVTVTDAQGLEILVFQRLGGKLVLVKPFPSKSQRSINVAHHDGAIVPTNHSIWHRRLAHINHQYANNALQDADIPLLLDEACITCAIAKATRKPCKTKREVAGCFLDRVHMDVGGGKNALPQAKPTTHSYLLSPNSSLLLTDHATNYRWVFFIDTKS